ncbi:MAG: hypothetical protein IPM51_16805 [Sphingobacteriaceae bacterium]|nr:hypothetical protein [Sphingobacteriaceae bacterium]
MNYEEEYNKSIQDKLDSREFSVDEEKWNVALQLISIQESKRKRKFLLWLLFPILFAFTGIGMFVFLTETDNTNLAKVKEETKIESNKVNAEINTEKVFKSESILLHVTKEENLNTSVTNSTKIDSISNKSKKIETKTISENKLRENHKSKQKITTKNISPQKNNNTNLNLANILNSNSNKHQDVLPYKIDKTEKQSENTKSIDSSPKINSDTTSVITERLNNKALTSMELPLVDSLKPDSSLVLKYEILPVPTASVNANTLLDVEQNKNNLFEIHSFIGGAFTPGYSTKPTLLKGINPVGGIILIFSSSKNVGLLFGCNYMSYGNADVNPKTYVSTYQEFGYKNEITEIYTDKLHYFKFPLLINYTKQKNSLSLGIQYSRLIGASSTIKTYSEFYGAKTDANIIRKYGYVNGIKNHDFSAMFSFRRKLKNNFGFGVNVDYGFIDVQDNSFFNLNHFDRNISIQLLISYKLFK